MSCDCGYSFSEGRMPFAAEQAQHEHEVNARRGQAMIVRGAVTLVIGVVITVGTFALASSSPSGGLYVICYGAIIVGILWMSRGAALRSRSGRR